MVTTFLDLSTSELLSRARQIKFRTYGNAITFSPKVFIPLTMLCQDRCGYCTFAKPPAHLTSPYMQLDEVVKIALAGQELGCSEALFTLGEKPEARYQAARDFLQTLDLTSTTGYLYQAAKKVLEETSLIPHLNAGALSFEEFAALKGVSGSQGMMVETLRPNIEAHKLSPDKTPERRLQALTDAGKAKVPFTTGILVGIGESEQDRVEALESIRDIALQYNHIQEVIIQNFLPKAHTLMSHHPPAVREEFIRAIALARIILPANVHLQAPPNLSDDLDEILAAGIDDLGGISPLTIDHVNPERAWPDLSVLERSLSAQGLHLIPRLPIYPEFSTGEWISDNLAYQIKLNSDAMGYARTDSWVSGGDSEPPFLVEVEKTSGHPRWTLVSELGLTQQTTEITEICDDALRGILPDEGQIETLFSAHGADLHYVISTADQLRKEISGDTVTFVANRNINYTNVCSFKCRFCAFSKGPLSLNLRGTPYLLDMDEITSRVIEAEQAGATEVCLQGGIHPNFDAEYYLAVIEAVKAGSPNIHIHAFSALEIHEGARRSGVDVGQYLARCKEAGLKSLPGTAAEILCDDIRETLCPDKIRTERWLEIHEEAHKVGLKSNITIMFGTFEAPRHWARHIAITRELQKRSGGFTEFVPLPFVHMASPIFLQKKARRGPTFREALLMHAVARIAYQHLVPNIQASWVKMGIDGARQLLKSGTNDLGGTLMDENISRAAGAVHGQQLTRDDFIKLVEPLQRRVAQRSTLYQILEPQI